MRLRSGRDNKRLSCQNLLVVFLIHRKILALTCRVAEFRDISLPTHAILPLSGKTKLLSTALGDGSSVGWKLALASASVMMGQLRAAVGPITCMKGDDHGGIRFRRNQD
jgi:hypothetical protein